MSLWPAPLVEPGEAAGKRGQHRRVGAAHRDVLQERLERDGLLAFEWLGVARLGLGQPNAVHDDEVGLGFGVGGHCR